MIDYAAARLAMIDGQVRTNDVTNTRLQDAMGTVPREHFVPKGKRPLAYMGETVDLGGGRHLMDPRSFSKLVQGLDVKSGDVVLDIGTGTGYSAAVLSHLCDAVVALECDEILADSANQVLSDLNILNAAVVHGPLEAGCAGQGPYDVILVSGGAEFVPQAWLSQLCDGGRLGVIVTEGRAGHAHLFVRTGETISERNLFDALVPVLPGLEKAEEFAF